MDCIIFVDSIQRKKKKHKSYTYTRTNISSTASVFICFIFHLFCALSSYSCVAVMAAFVSIIFHTFYFDYFIRTVWKCKCRIVFSHGTGFFFHFVLFSHLGLLSFRIHWSAECVYVYIHVWTHAFGRHDIELAASIYFSILFFISFVGIFTYLC